ncbi:MAG: DNA-3-methyladenine glycosylase 2 family protein, partial [Acidimicrobiia bacterium]|nr:DNA-3-methyladenine glycosylase 2 family protein [Acidimicrobiia bacterium]
MDPFDLLIDRDDALADVVRQAGKPPPFERPPTFASLVLLILEQQVSLSSAAATYTRLEALGEIQPRAILQLDPDVVRSAGVTRQKARYLRELSAAVVDRRLPLDDFGSMTDDEVRRRLVAITGIGTWTADVFLLACLQRPDVWPVGDRALQVGTAEALGLEAVPDPTRLEEIGDRWRPHRSAAARIIWHGYLHSRGRLHEG